MTWPKFLAIYATATILVGAAVLCYSLRDSSSDNWRPVHLPLPAPTMTVSDTFALASKGHFQVQVVTSATKAEQAALNREGPPVEMFITLEISGPKGFRVNRTITQMLLSSEGHDTDSYTDGVIFLPHSGEYDISFKCGKRAAIFADRGGVIQFDRVAPSGYGLLYPVLNGFASLCFLSACGSILLILNRCAKRGAI